jgi:hypothetical protein
MEEWIVVDPKDQERIWDVALALLARGPGQGGPETLEQALQRGCAELYAARLSLKKGLRFYMEDEEGEKHLRRVRVLENGSWVNEKAKPRKKADEAP